MAGSANAVKTKTRRRQALALCVWFPSRAAQLAAAAAAAAAAKEPPKKPNRQSLSRQWPEDFPLVILRLLQPRFLLLSRAPQPSERQRLLRQAGNVHAVRMRTQHRLPRVARVSCQSRVRQVEETRAREVAVRALLRLLCLFRLLLRQSRHRRRRRPSQ